MRVGDCSLEVVPVGGGSVRELPSGHVLARPGQVYLLRLRNLGPLRAVAEVRVDGRRVSAGGLVLDPGASIDLERPIHATERGRFTVVSEGDEGVFGPDGGRDNADLGLIEVRFRRELPHGGGSGGAPWPRPMVTVPAPDGPRPLPPSPFPSPFPSPAPGTPPAPRWPAVPPEWTPPTAIRASAAAARPAVERGRGAFPPDMVERAAGTGLTGHSDQEFRPVQVGELEREATVLRLRLVVGNPDAIDAARALPDEERAPARPAARP